MNKTKKSVDEGKTELIGVEEVPECSLEFEVEPVHNEHESSDNTAIHVPSTATAPPMAPPGLQQQPGYQVQRQQVQLVLQQQQVSTPSLPSDIFAVLV